MPGREREIFLVQARCLAFERLERSAVVDDVVGRGEALSARRLRGEYGANLRFRQAAAPHDALDLQRFGTVDHQHARRARPIHPALHQERNHQNRVGAPGALEAALAFGPYERMQYRLQSFSGLSVTEREAAHPRAIEGPVGRDRLGAERGAEGRVRLAPRPRQLVGDLVGVDHGGAELGKPSRDRALSAADAARESDGVRLQMNWLRYWRVSWGPQNSATTPAAPR